jgi:tetratricopeptide (TPR) repeat protein
MADDRNKKDDHSAESARERIQAQAKLKEALTGQLQSGRLQGAAAAGRPLPSQKKLDTASPGTKSASIPAPRPPPPKAVMRPEKAPKPAIAPKRPPAEPPAPPRESAPAEKVPAENAVPWDPRRVRMFLTGAITLGELEGISKEAQYEIAEVGHQHLQQAHYDQAKQIFDGLAVLDPHDAYFQMALGAIAQRTGALEEAEARYSRSIEINPFSCHAYANRGEVRLLTGRLVDGAKDLLRALEEDPECREIATKRARATLGVVVQELRDAGIEIPGTGGDEVPTLSDDPARDR